MERNQESLIPRPSPELTTRILGRTVLLHYNNASLYEFGEQYKHVNHLYIAPEHWEKPVYIFANPGQDLTKSPLWTAMREKDFGYFFKAYPTDQDLEVYMEHQARRLEEELSGEL